MILYESRQDASTYVEVSSGLTWHCWRAGLVREAGTGDSNLPDEWHTRLSLGPLRLTVVVERYR